MSQKLISKMLLGKVVYSDRALVVAFSVFAKQIIIFLYHVNCRVFNIKIMQIN